MVDGIDGGSPQTDRSTQRFIGSHGAPALGDLQDTRLRHPDGHGANPWHQGTPRIRRQRPGGFRRADRGRRLPGLQEALDGIANLLVRRRRRSFRHADDRRTSSHAIFGASYRNTVRSCWLTECQSREGKKRSTSPALKKRLHSAYRADCLK